MQRPRIDDDVAEAVDAVVRAETDLRADTLEFSQKLRIVMGKHADRVEASASKAWERKLPVSIRESLREE